MAAFIYATSLILLSLGFTTTYNSTRAPNYTIGPIMAMGSYTAFTISRILQFPAYLGLPAAFILGIMVSAAIYKLVIQPMKRWNRSDVLITLSSIGVSIVLTGFIEIFAFCVNTEIHIYSVSFLLKEKDFIIGNIPGVFLVSSITAALTYLLWRYTFSKTTFGYKYRVIKENSELSMIQGIDPERVWLLVWGLSGGLAAFSGALSCLWFKATPLMGPWIMTPIIAASLLGGLDNHRGFFIGGLIVGLAEIMLTSLGQAIVGVWVGEYRPLISISILVLVLMFRPQGIMGKTVS